MTLPADDCVKHWMAWVSCQKRLAYHGLRFSIEMVLNQGSHYHHTQAQHLSPFHLYHLPTTLSAWPQVTQIWP
jgi:hypothetical protein